MSTVGSSWSTHTSAGSELSGSQASTASLMLCCTAAASVVSAVSEASAPSAARASCAESSEASAASPSSEVMSGESPRGVGKAAGLQTCSTTALGCSGCRPTATTCACGAEASSAGAGRPSENLGDIIGKPSSSWLAFQSPACGFGPSESRTSLGVGQGPLKAGVCEKARSRTASLPTPCLSANTLEDGEAFSSGNPSSCCALQTNSSKQSMNLWHAIMSLKTKASFLLLKTTTMICSVSVGGECCFSAGYHLPAFFVKRYTLDTLARGNSMMRPLLWSSFSVDMSSINWQWMSE
mmetsp:Transcript_102309/g.319668  ORF Transcript_102309/g.319668 Transcript_102309/m.319668 type:complete len:295 (-) Transcript_102309:545-1429(-)